MAQLAYCHTADTTAPQPAMPLEGDGPALALSLFGSDERRLALVAIDARAAGLRPAPVRALESIAAHSGGVLGDVVVVDCPLVGAAEMAALLRLDERVARSGAQLVVATSPESLDAVFGCLALSRPQIVVGARQADIVIALGAAVAQASGRRLRELGEDERMALLRLTEQVGKLADQLDRFGGHGIGQADPAAIRVESPGLDFRHEPRPRPVLRNTRAPLPDPRLVQKIIRRRQARARFFDGDLFADPAWDILLDLTAARAEHRRVSVTSLCIAAGVPATTALRWISQMVESGILVRVQDQEDRRRAFIALSDATADAMARYFEAIGTETALLG